MSDVEHNQSSAVVFKLLGIYNAHNSSAVFDIACNVFLLHCTDRIQSIPLTSMFIKSSSDSELRCSSEFDNT